MRRSPLFWVRAVTTLARTYGLEGLAFRGSHEVRRAAAWFRSEPRHPVGRTQGSALFRPSASAIAAATDPKEALRRSERVCRGEYLAYRWRWRTLPEGEGWRSHPTSGETLPLLPWWRLSTLRPGSDIKDIWESARFAWVFDLARGHILTGSPSYREAFLQRVRNWWSANPPFLGPHWACGQEVAIRALALLQVEHVLASEDEEATALLLEIFGASGERIADAFGYALSQRNNHAISEAVGLIALGTRLAGAHPEAEGWYRRGRRHLEKLVAEQFAPDGWYIQHSFNYTRLVLDQLVLASHVLRSRGEALSREARGRIGAAVELLAAVIDADSGELPLHGNSDGSYVLPLSLSAYQDYRPSLQAAAALFSVPLPDDLRLGEGEVRAWLGLPAPGRTSARPGVRRGGSGWVVARVGPVAVFLRAGRYRARPGHLDALHLCVSANGAPMVVDPGTYAYNAPHPWRNGLSSAHVHNGPQVEGREAGVRGPRFLWLTWPRAEIVRVREGTEEVEIVARCPGIAERRVRVRPGGVEVEDRVLGEPGTLQVTWTLHPDQSPDGLDIEGPSEEVETTENALPGWFAPCYGLRIPAPARRVRRRLDPSERLLTRLNVAPAASGPGAAS